MYFYTCLESQYREKISSNYKIDEIVFISFVKNFLRLRNICAHHSRLWNIKLNTCSIRYPKSKIKNHSDITNSINFNNNENIYNSIVFLLHIQNVIKKENEWKNKFINFIESSLNAGIISHRQLEKFMGFPVNWKTLSIWRKF
jgi:abortive infection bacteriophage resistance protein